MFRRLPFALVAASLLAITSLPTTRAGVIETEVEVAPGVNGTLANPLTKAAPRQVVLMFHGWCGNRDDAGAMFKRLAADLADHGITSLRIDFRGEGERHGQYLTSTFATRIADAEASLALARERFPQTKIGVVGFSLGGATAMALAGRHPTEVDSLVLWSTAGDLAVDFFTNEEMKPAIREALEKGEAVFQSWVPLTLTRDHLLGFIGYDLFGPLAAYHGALLGIRGSADYLTPYEPRILAAANGSPEESVVIGGADHIYNCIDPASTHDERVITLTSDWLHETL